MAKTEKPPIQKKRFSGTAALRELSGRFGIIFLISACMFTLGVFVGRGTAPVRFDIEKLQGELAARRAAILQEERDHFEQEKDSIDRQAELEFFRTLKEPDKSEIQNAPIKPKTSLKAKTKSTGARVTVPEPEVASVSEPAPRKIPVRDQPQAENGLTIQVASVKVARDADRMVSLLKQKGYPAYRTVATIDDRGTWYRVRVGNFASRTEAGAMMARLKKDSFTAILVRQ